MVLWSVLLDSLLGSILSMYPNPRKVKRIPLLAPWLQAYDIKPQIIPQVQATLVLVNFVGESLANFHTPILLFSLLHFPAFI